MGDWEVALAEIMYPNSFENVTDGTEQDGMKENEMKIHTINGVKSVFLPPASYTSLSTLLNACIKTTKRYDLTFGRLNNYFRVIIGKDTITFSKKLGYILGFTDLNVTKNQLADYPVDMRAGMDALYVYCDILDLSMVGDSMQPLLRAIPCKGEFGEIVHLEFTHLHYVPLLYKQFSSIGISIKDDLSHRVAFKFGKSVLKLHFRKQ